MKDLSKNTIIIVCEDGNFNYKEIESIIELNYKSGVRIMELKIDMHTLTKQKSTDALYFLFLFVRRLMDEFDIVILVKLVVEIAKIRARMLINNRDVIDTVIAFANEKNFKEKDFHTIRGLINHGVICRLYNDSKDYRGIISFYKKYYKFGIGIEVSDDVSYSDIREDEFIRWVYHRDGVALSLFSDIVNRAILGFSSSCHFSSCLGHQVVYYKHRWGICPYVKENIKLKGTVDCFVYRDLFVTEEVKHILEKAVAKRNECKATCDYYSECRGGCVFVQNENDCRYKKYFALVEVMKKEVENLINEEKNLEILNPCVRNSLFLKMSS